MATATSPKAATSKEEEAKKILANADQALEAVDQSFIFTSQSCRDFPTFQFREITTGELLGKGGFSGVHEIQEIRLLRPDNGDTGSPQPVVLDESPDTQQDEDHYDAKNARTFMSKRFLRAGSPRYAIKKLKPELGVVDRARGAVDLAIEIKFLSAIWHPNISTFHSDRVDEKEKESGEKESPRYHYFSSGFQVSLLFCLPPIQLK